MPRVLGIAHQRARILLRKTRSKILCSPNGLAFCSAKQGVKSSAHQRARILLRKTRSKILCSPKGSHFAPQNKEDYEMENETKLCKHCKSEIPKDAKVCPNCRKKQGGIGKWIVIVVVVVIIIAAMSGGGADKPKKVENASTQNNTDNKADVVNDTTEDTSVKQEDSEKDIFGIGETAEMNDVQVTMVNYTQSSGSEYNKPADGNEFVLVEFEIANNSDSEINISSMASFEAYADDYALNYSVSALLEKNDQNQIRWNHCSREKNEWCDWV